MEEEPASQTVEEVPASHPVEESMEKPKTEEDAAFSGMTEEQAEIEPAAVVAEEAWEEEKVDDTPDDPVNGIKIRADELERFEKVGKNGLSLLQRISLCAGAQLNVKEATGWGTPPKLTITSDSQSATSLAEKYLRITREANDGWVSIQRDRDDDGDLSMVDVPSSAYQDVLGRNGGKLNSIGEETCVIMFFDTTDDTAVDVETKEEPAAIVADAKDDAEGTDAQEPEKPEGEQEGEAKEDTVATDHTAAESEWKEQEPQWKDQVETVYRVAIFGELKARTLAQLRVMSIVDARQSGYYTDKTVEWGAPPEADWSVDVVEIEKEFLGQAIGQKGAMRRKLSRASGCVIDYLGTAAHIVGAKSNRAFAAALLQALRSQERGTIWSVPEDTEGYYESMQLPENLPAFSLGRGGEMGLNRIEEDYGVIIFFKEEEVKEEAAKEEGGDGETTEPKAEDAAAPAEGDAALEGGAAPTGDAAPVATEETDDVPAAEDAKAADEEKTEETWPAQTWPAETWPAETWAPPGLQKQSPQEVLIFSASARARKLARLRIESEVERKLPGQYTEGVVPIISDDEELNTDIVQLPEDGVSWAAGKLNANRRKIQAAAGCGVELLGSFAYFLGTAAERERGRRYMQLHMSLRGGNRFLRSADENRSDVTVVPLTSAQRDYLDIHSLMAVEANTDTIIFHREVPDSALIERGAWITITRAGRVLQAQILDGGVVVDGESGVYKMSFAIPDADGNTSNTDIETADDNALSSVVICGQDAGPSGATGRSLAEKQVNILLAGGSLPEKVDLTAPQSRAGGAGGGWNQQAASRGGGGGGWDSKGDAGGGAWDKGNAGNSWDKDTTKADPWGSFSGSKDASASNAWGQADNNNWNAGGGATKDKWGSSAPANTWGQAAPAADNAWKAAATPEAQGGLWANWKSGAASAPEPYAQKGQSSDFGGGNGWGGGKSGGNAWSQGGSGGGAGQSGGWGGQQGQSGGQSAVNAWDRWSPGGAKAATSNW